jgi:hypothetical protein
LAKVLEILDKPVFALTKISGHTLKHVVASLAAFFILNMLKRRTGKT